MRPKRKLIAWVCLILVSISLALYTFQAHSIAADHICEDVDGKTWWRTAPSGSLLPWPREPGMLQALSEVDEADLFVYCHLIKPGLLGGFAILLWAGAGLWTYRLIRTRSGL